MTRPPDLRTFVAALPLVASLALAAGCVGPDHEPLPVQETQEPKEDRTAKGVRPLLHPSVFEQILCWISDTEQPVVTEFSLDALERNRNQFPYAVRAHDGEWEEWQRENNAGFARYRFLPDEDGHFMVEYQDNGGGSLTTSTRIGFSVLTRTIAKNGHPEKIRVLRVESIESVPQPGK